MSSWYQKIIPENYLLFTARKQSLEQGNVCIHVCLFKGGEFAFGGLPTGGQHPRSPALGGLGQTPPPPPEPGKRAVRILLKCFVVVSISLSDKNWSVRKGILFIELKWQYSIDEGNSTPHFKPKHSCTRKILAELKWHLFQCCYLGLFGENPSVFLIISEQDWFKYYQKINER